ncbi:hypothetical protein [Qipengyuania sp. NPDC077563]|uniref:hypothetical protein n=1 Tax=Qipengyuania sp. NPDC077563 TaxID=3364497 RepID=UPI00384DCF21
MKIQAVFSLSSSSKMQLRMVAGVTRACGQDALAREIEQCGRAHKHKYVHPACAPFI